MRRRNFRPTICGTILESRRLMSGTVQPPPPYIDPLDPGYTPPDPGDSLPPPGDWRPPDAGLC